ncbi:MAG: ABC transporter permease [Bacilli bacterium]|nr:ABC transporter permease [Bacilli bacterium]
MIKFILKRIGYALLTVLLLMGITFTMMHSLPGDPFVNEKATSEQVKEAQRAKYGLDKPLPEQFVIYVSQVLQGDFGMSYKTNRPVATIISDAFPYSCELGIRAIIIAIVTGIALGAYAAIRRGRAGDTISMLIAVIGVSVPSFIVAALLQYFVSLKLGQVVGSQLFPVTGWTTEASKVLPAIALSFGTMATISRLMRTSMLDVLASDYIKTAKAKGLSEGTIIKRHALRNACMPVVTVLGPTIAALLTGAFVVEKVFAIPGMGKFFVNAITQQDYNLIAGTTLFYGIFLIISILVVDVLYGFIDPRINMAGKKE